MLGSQNKHKGNRYQLLQRIGSGGMGSVYEVLDRLNGIRVALKEVINDPDKLLFASQQSVDSRSTPEYALANEFRILAGLRHPNIVSVLDYGFDEQKQPYFTMDLLEQPKRITEAVQGQEFLTRIQLAAQLLQALDYLHQRKIIHRDLKPANVLVTQEGQVKVLDFGLALSVEYMKQLATTASGTLAYLAPEVLQGESVSIESDLYAFGLIFYEMLTEQYPFNTLNINVLLSQIIHQEPDYTPIEPSLQPILMRLLDKKPTERYHDVESLLKDLSAATGFSLPRETIAIRESFLQAASFVGREPQIAQIEDYLESAKQAKGSTWLIGGESGVGKSRFISEIRVRALIDNLFVVRGQAIAEGSAPFQMWRDIIAWMVLLQTPSEVNLRTLKELVPNLEALLNRTIEDAPEVPPSTAVERLNSAILDLFLNQKRPMLILLEDLQWAGQESLALLGRLSQFVPRLPILILSTYRIEEAPDLPTRIPDAQVMKLERFDQNQIAVLSTSILGAIGQSPQILAFLERETAGNTLFVIEILRALAENAGELHKIAETPLPETIRAGGIIAVIQKRLSLLPQAAHRVLEIAAVIGREIDLPLLKHQFPDLDFDQWTLLGANSAVLEPDGNRWRFLHDKIRESLLIELERDNAQYRNLQRQVGEATESVYGEIPDRLPALAYHWKEADVPDKAVYYLEQAALQARLGNYNQAIEYVHTASLFDTRITLKLEQQIIRFNVLGSGYYGNADYQNALTNYQEVLRLQSLPMVPQGNLALMTQLMRQLGQQTLHRVRPQRYLAQRDSLPIDRVISSTLLLMQSAYLAQGKIGEMLYIGLIMLNFLEQIRPEKDLNPALSYATLTLTTGLLGLTGISKHYRQLAQSSPEMVYTDQAQIIGLLGFNDFQFARWDQSRVALEQVIEMFEESGGPHSADSTRVILAWLHLHQGNFDQAFVVLETAFQKSLWRDDTKNIFDSLMLLAKVRILRGEIAQLEQIDLLQEEALAEERFKKEFELNAANKALYRGTCAMIAVMNGDPARAWQLLQQLNAAWPKPPLDRTPTAFGLYELITAVCVRLLEGKTVSDLAQLNAIYTQYRKLLSAYAKTFVFAQPRALLHQGWSAYHAQKSADAAKYWTQAYERAQALNMPYERALAGFALGKFPDQTAAQNEAKAIAQRLQVSETMDIPIY